MCGLQTSDFADAANRRDYPGRGVANSADAGAGTGLVRALETLAAARPRAVRSVIISYRYAGRPWIQVRTLITRRTNPARRAPAPGAPKQPPDLMITVGCCRMQQETHRDHEVQGFMFAPVTLGSPPRMDLDGRDSYG